MSATPGGSAVAQSSDPRAFRFGRGHGLSRPPRGWHDRSKTLAFEAAASGGRLLLVTPPPMVAPSLTPASKNAIGSPA
jgi:hypothetical protein